MRRSILLATAGLLLIGMALLLTHRPPPRETPAAPPPVAATPAPPPMLKPPPPAFDVVRVTPEGRAVIAGRATAHASVTVFDDAAEIGRVGADTRGEWVFVPDKPLRPGPHRLHLRATDGAGRAVDGEAPVVVVVPEQAAPGEVLAVRLGADGVEVLQAPQAGEPPAIAIEAATQLAPDATFFAGRGPTGAQLQVYFDDRHLGGTVADRNGRWRLAANLAIKPGLHVIRADLIGAQGVEKRAEVLLDHGGFAAVAPGQSVVVEHHGDRWRIKHDDRPTTVYQAGPEQQRDPAPVRPGQLR